MEKTQQPRNSSENDNSVSKGRVSLETKDLEYSALDKEVSDHDTASEKPKIEKARGVRRMENVKLLLNHDKHGKTAKILLSLSICICAWVYALDNSTVNNYTPLATSAFNEHAMLSTVQIATSIISSVIKPFIAKFSDHTSRPYTFILLLVVYTIGYVVIASSKNITSYIVGSVLVEIGSAGVAFLYGVIASDLTPLQWRAMMHAILGSPYIINTWFAGLIVQDISSTNWRWGYGMFAIIMPVVLTPAIIVMVYYEHRAQGLEGADQGTKAPTNKLDTLLNGLREIDAIGLILMGFGWSLLLLPFSLYKGAKGGWSNPSIIAMLVVGFVLLVIYSVYELKWAKNPSMPKRMLLNRTFMTAIAIDFFYYFTGYIRSTYLSSYVYIVKNWSTQNWTYFNNTLTMSLCVFVFIAAVWQRVFHRYKFIQIVGLTIKLVGFLTVVRPIGTIQNTASLVWGQILVGLGGSFSVVGTQVASQASVPHDDLALAIALLSLYTNIGGAIGSAISAAIWTSKMPGNLRKHMPASVSDAQVTKYYSNLSLIRALPWGSEERQAAIQAYSETFFYLLVPAAALSVIPVVIAFFQSNFFLGNTLNVVEDIDPREKEERLAEKPKPITFKEKFLAFYNR